MALSSCWSVIVMVAFLLVVLSPTIAWTTHRYLSSKLPVRSSTSISNHGNKFLEDDIARLQRKAQLQLEKARAKLAAKQQQQQPQITSKNRALTAAPFFASIDTKNSDPMPTAIANKSDYHDDNFQEQQERLQRHDSVIKSVDAQGLILADGEKMAALSEQEPWERRSLLLTSSKNDDDDEDEEWPLSNDSRRRRRRRHQSSGAERDLSAASIFNLRKQLQTSDFQQIFDSKNRFIGETE